MYLKVVSLKGIEFEGQIKSLNIPTQNGEITVLDNHRPIISVLKPGMAIITETNNEKKEVEINGGFLEVDDNNHLNVLIN
jgi:F-type H+-transporting ATPase subunit epsilon